MGNKEFEIMKFLWENEDGITFKDLCNSINSQDGSTKPNTIHTHLTRLINKGYVKAEGIKRRRLYFPLISRPEYDKFLARRIVNQLFEGSLKNFVSAFTFNEGFTEQEISALKALLEKKGE